MFQCIPEDADSLKQVGVLTIYKILLIYVCCAFVGLEIKLYRRFFFSLSGLYNPSDKDAGSCVGSTGDFAF